jgi:hypothetical protein
MARVLVDLVSGPAVEVECDGPRPRVRRGIVDRELVAQRVGVDAPQPLDEQQVFAVQGAVAVAAEPRAIGEVLGFDDERVAVEPAARVAHPHSDAGAGMRAAVERNHARFVDHLVADGDDAGRLHDLRAVPVDHGQHRADQAAREAAIVVREIRVRRRQAAVAASAAFRHALLTGRRQLR